MNAQGEPTTPDGAETPVQDPSAATKRCDICERSLPLDQFYRLHKTGEERQARCKRCDNLVRAKGLRTVRAMLAAAGEAHALDLDREGRRYTPRRPAPQVTEGEAEEQDGQEDLADGVVAPALLEPGYRAQPQVALTANDHDEAERFAAIAAFYFRGGVRLAVAWQRANEWLAEHPGELPEGVTVARDPVGIAKMPGSRLVELVTPDDRRVAPREAQVEQLGELAAREHAGVVDSDDQELPEIDLTAPLFDRPGELARASDSPVTAAPKLGYLRTRLPKAKATPAITPAAEPERRETMSIKDEVFEGLKKHGPITTAALAELLKRESGQVSGPLNALKSEGLVTKGEGYGAEWAVAKGGAKKGFESFVADKRAVEDATLDKCLETLVGGEELAISEIAERSKLDADVVRLAMRRAKDAGRAKVAGMARAARWSLVGRSKTIEDVAKRAAKKPARAKATNGNGNGHAKASAHEAPPPCRTIPSRQRCSP